MSDYVISVNLAQLALQMFDRKVIDKGKLSEILGIDFETGKTNGILWDQNSCNSANSTDSFQILMQLYDRQLVSGEAVAKRFDKISKETEKKE